MWSVILFNSVLYFVAVMAALFLILALQVFMRIMNLNERYWRIFPHSLFLEASGKPRFGFRKRIAVFLTGSYLFIFVALILIAER